MFPKGMGGMMKKAQQMQKEMARIQKEIEELKIDGQSGGGLVKVVVSGKKKILSVDIDSDVMKEDKEMVEDLILAAMKNAFDNAEKESAEKMKSVTGGMPNIPGF